MGRVSATVNRDSATIDFMALLLSFAVLDFLRHLEATKHE
jgi:hypothetical protein